MSSRRAIFLVIGIVFCALIAGLATLYFYPVAMEPVKIDPIQTGSISSEVSDANGSGNPSLPSRPSRSIPNAGNRSSGKAENDQAPRPDSRTDEPRKPNPPSRTQIPPDPPPGQTTYGSQYKSTNWMTGSACTSGDNSGRINNELRQALSNGKDGYRLPEGTCQIDSAINIPDGTSNFSILGAGSDRTIIKSPTVRLNNAFEIGFSHMSHNNWGLTDLPTSPLAKADQNSDEVELKVGQTTLSPGWYIVWDDNQIVNRYGQGFIYNRAEIVEVKSYNASTRKAKLDIALGRSFTVNPKISSATGRLAHNITIGGYAFDATGPNNQFSNGGLYASMIRNLTVIDIAVKKFQGPAVSLMLTRNADVSKISMTDNIGSYGLGVNKSRFTDVHDSFAAPSVGTAFIGHTGTQDAIFRNLTTPRVDASHGFDEKRITVKDITGNFTHPDYPGEAMADLTCGNLAWRDGVDGCFIENNPSAHEVFSGPNARNVVVNNTNMHVLRLNEEDGIGPVSTVVKNSLIRRKGIYNWVVNLDWFRTDTIIGRVELDNTKIINDDPNGNFVIKGTNYIGELIIKNSEIINNSSRGYEMIYLKTNRDSKLSVINTKFTSGSSDKAIYLDSFLNPCVEIKNNIYQIMGNNPTQFDNTNICQ